MRARFERDLTKCEPYTFAMWKARPFPKRFTEWLAGPFRSEL
jgi:hypothetical protein